MLKTKTSAFLSLLLVFGSGALVGGVAVRLYNTTGVVSTTTKEKSGPRDPAEVRNARVAEMKTRVHLDDQQVVQLEKIYDDTTAQFFQLRDQMHKKQSAEMLALRESQAEKVRQMLHPDQLPAYEQLHSEHEAAIKLRAEKDAQKNRKQPPPASK